MEKRCWITSEPLEIEDVTKRVIRREAGAVNTFIGTVREFTKGKRTLYLQYETYKEMAEKKLEQITKEMERQWPSADVVIAHRVGRLEITDVAVIIAVSTPHRNDSYEASRYAIERIKEIVPIWKKEHWEDGEEWIGDQKEVKPGVPLKEEIK
ncbi:molybdenum cofactor biosynthesis protein MoaE [Halobacillus sp. Nhm2S1]|uniref:molybdenum cofactor biosynthesis protein MoaE n=1 Tax=Halobacillus sp. Nhm2S1 TaxID=2866716 RepID=UPI001C73A406|nr:molybdenum cofactor biosynthesis protein MoaE [Halobacillus sp. Nhm2S1]MBX0357127.1 molybdenum cofactor biosynthesis protein MoaE [Halobacillus sp. Nhm2S1]